MALSLVRYLELADQIKAKLKESSASCAHDTPGGLGCSVCKQVTLLACTESLAKELFEAHGCVRNSCSSCEFCWGYKGKSNAPELYSTACNFCRAYFERLGSSTLVTSTKEGATG